MTREAVLAACAVVITSAWAVAQDALDPSASTGTYRWPFAFEEQEPVVTASPAAKVSFELPAGMIIRDYEASPLGDEAVVIVENAAHRQSVAFWRFDSKGFARSVDIPPQTSLASVTWHPQGGAIFLIATGARGSQILRLDAASKTFAPREIFASSRALRRLVVGPRPFLVGDDTVPSYRLFFGERHPDGSYSLQSVSENGKAQYTVVGPQTDIKYRGRADEEVPKTTIAPFSLPLAFHPAGNMLIWEDGKKCLHKLTYRLDNWGESEPFGSECGLTATYTPNGIATIGWQSRRPGVRIHGLTSGGNEVALAEYTFDSIPSHMPDGRGVVAVTSSNGKKTLHYLPIAVPLADVANAWMYTENAADLQKFTRAGGLFRPLPKDEQLHSFYDSESYYCGGPDVRVPTRPYFVTTDLFWELYAAAFDGLFIVLEREQAMPAFARFVTAADAQLRARHPGTAMARAFAAAHAVLEGHADNDAEARLIVAAAGRAPSPAVNKTLDYAEFRPRGHYTSVDQKRYFAAARYLGALPLSADETALLRSLGDAVSRAALSWISVYQPFAASSRLALVWGGDTTASSIASHRLNDTRMFPLSWGWDNEALDNVVDHSDRPPAERVVTQDGTSRVLPSGLDFASVAGNRLAYELLGSGGVLSKFPNLVSRIGATRGRFLAAAGKSRVSLYDDWIAALATQWADTRPDSPLAGPLWDVKRLQTGLASWTTLRHATVLVNDKAQAECGEAGFESIVMRPPRGYVEPDPATFGAIAGLFDATIAVIRRSATNVGDGTINPQLREGIIRRLTESRDNTLKYQR